MKNNISTTIYLLRHAPTEHNEKKIFQGHSDRKENYLTESGKKEAEIYAEQFTDVQFDALFSSDLARSKETAEIIAKKHNLHVETTPLLRGKRMGRYEGVSVADYREKNKVALEKLRLMPAELQWKYKDTEGMESNEEVLWRLLTFLEQLIIKYSGKKILIITHGGAMRNLLFHIGWAKQQELRAGSVKNGAIIKIKYDGAHLLLEDVVGFTKETQIS